MDRDALITEDDVRAMVRLVGDVAIAHSDQTARRHHLMEGLCRLIDADVWVWLVTERVSEDGQWFPVSNMHGGMTDAEFAILIEANTDTDHPVPETAPLDREVVGSTATLTRVRRQLVPDDAWYADPNTKLYREGFVDDFIFTLTPLRDDGCKISAVGLHRRWGRPAFTAREARMAHIVLTEVDWLHRMADDAVPADTTTAGLTPRLRGMLGYLLDGWSQPKIAQHVGLSPHTVGGYVKDIYRHFRVHSRNELFKKFTTGNGGDRA